MRLGLNMILCKPSYEILTNLNGPEILKLIELAGRTCYKSESNITDESATKFCENILKLGHESVIEHASITVRFIANRGFTHELVRHRLASFSQESTRYCNYKGGVTFIIPPWVDVKPGKYKPPLLYSAIFPENTDKGILLWFGAMGCNENMYLALLNQGWTPQQARGVLPIDLKTEIIMTANIREWRHIFKLRCSRKAHPQMRELMIPLRNELSAKVPILFREYNEE